MARRNITPVSKGRSPRLRSRAARVPSLESGEVRASEAGCDTVQRFCNSRMVDTTLIGGEEDRSVKDRGELSM